MKEVGIRELKNSLSAYLRAVREGESVVVTDRGIPVARIIPAGISRELAALIAQGRVSWSGERFDPPRRPVEAKPGPALSEYISEDRR